MVIYVRWARVSVWVSMTIVCNSCEAELPLKLGTTVRNARQLLADEGWSCIGGREDYCPTCTKATRVTKLALVK